MDWKNAAYQALVAVVVVVLVLALLNVLRAQSRGRVDPVAWLSRPFYPSMPDDTSGVSA